LVIATNGAPPELLAYAESGGRVLVVSPNPPEFPIAEVTKPLKISKVTSAFATTRNSRLSKTRTYCYWTARSLKYTQTRR
jgi:hypothetical protein